MYVKAASVLFVIFFFFQAEDGIRDLIVTGVQTCALPISEDLVAWHDWKLRVPPVVVHLVHVAVANATVENFDLDVVRSRIASLDRHRRNRRLGCAGAIGRSLLGHGQGRTSLG